MYTEFKINNKIFKYTTQQYEIGLYVFCSYNNDRDYDQFASNKQEKRFHVDLRKRVIKDGGILLNGTYIDSKSKVNINNFQNADN